MAGRRTLVAEEGGELVGFCELEEEGHLDMFYVRKDAVGRGFRVLSERRVSRQGVELTNFAMEKSLRLPDVEGEQGML